MTAQSTGGKAGPVLAPVATAEESVSRPAGPQQVRQPVTELNDTEQAAADLNVGLGDVAALRAGGGSKNSAVSNDGENEPITAEADRIADAIVDDAIRQLKKSADCLLSGVDSNLHNAWEEICVQVQGEQTIAWETYVDMIYSILVPAAESLTPDEQDLLWLATEGGHDWQFENDDDDDDDDDTGEGELGTNLSPPVAVDDIVDYLRDLLLTAAEQFENGNVRSYLVKHAVD